MPEAITVHKEISNHSSLSEETGVKECGERKAKTEWIWVCLGIGATCVLNDEYQVTSEGTLF